MRAGLATAVAVALCVLAGFAPVASADIQPAVTAQLVDEGLDADARRTVRVEVSGSCGPAATPTTKVEVLAQIRGRWADDERKPYEPSASHVKALGPADWVPGSTATFRFRLSGGLVATAIGSVQCYDEETDDSGLADSGFTDTVRAPVRLAGWKANATSATYRKSSCRLRRKGMEVGAGYDISWDLDIDPRGLLGTANLSSRHLKQIRLHIAGGGRRPLTFRPSRRGYSLYGGLLLNGFYLIPRRAKPVRLWVTVGGMDSNVIRVKVRPKPSGC